MEAALNKLDVYTLAHDLALRVHAMAVKLPAIERFEEAPQIRRSSKRVSASIVEGHTQRKYKGHYLSYLYRALGSSDETQEHLLLIFKTGSLSDRNAFEGLLKSYEDLSGKLFRLIQSVEKRYETPKYLTDQSVHRLESPPMDQTSKD